MPVQFVGWSRLSFHRFVVSSCHFVVSSCHFVVSTRPLREAIIRVHYMKCLPDSMHLYMTRLFIICSLLTENSQMDSLKSYLPHSIEFVLNRVNERFNVSAS